MKQLLLLVLMAALCAAYAQGPLGAPAGATNIVITSETVFEPAWKRSVVMQDGDGMIFNDDGSVGSAAESAASGEAAVRAAEISDAANVAMSNALTSLNVAGATAATNAIALALAIMPETSRTNLTAYVVKTETTGIVDTQWVWYNRQIDLAPNRYVVYETHDHAATNKVTWIDWQTTHTVTHKGRTWQGCHKCTVTRPTWAQGESCLDLPNDRLGGPAGFDFGDLLITIGGVPGYTGFVTNGVTGAVLYFDNGFCKGSPTEETTP